MKKLLIAASAFAGLAGLSASANAADMPLPPTYDWTGAYGGVTLGLGFDNSEIDSRIHLPGGTVSNALWGDEISLSGGAMLGYNWQVDGLVLGLETDFNFLNLNDSKDSGRDGAATILLGAPANATSSLSYDGDWYGTLRGRLGFAIDNLLMYGTGGLAYGNMSGNSRVEAETQSGTASWNGSEDAVNWGWSAGFGMEYGIDQWSLGVEYLYVDLGTADWNADADIACCRDRQQALDAADAEGELDYQFSVIRATARLHF